MSCGWERWLASHVLEEAHVKLHSTHLVPVVWRGNLSGGLKIDHDKS